MKRIKNAVDKVRKPCHPMVREIVMEELVARGWSNPAFIIAEISMCSYDNAKRLLRFESRLTRLQCMMLEKAFGVSDGFFWRLQNGCEKQYPQNGR